MAKHGKTKKYKAQHFIPQCYMKPWCDPTAPAGPQSTPFVWQFDRDGQNARRKAPKNLFTETDIYTIEMPNGERDLWLEHGLQDLEDKFTRIRNLRFARRDWPTVEETAWLLAFVATAQTRTVAHRNFHREQWAGIRARMEEMQEAMRKASSKQRAVMARGMPPSPGGRGMAIEDMRHFEEQPIQRMMAPTLRAVLPIYARMSIAVLCTDDPLGFVTTDEPCTWFDPEAYKLPPAYRGVGLAVRTIEVTLPISPKQCLLITHNPAYQGYIEIDERALNELNRRHIMHCDESFIACRNEVRAVWFEQMPMPDDAWEKVRERKIAAGEWSDS